MSRADVPLCSTYVCLALHRFSQSSQLLHSLMWRSPVQNFNEKGKETWKVPVEILFTALSKGSCH